MYPRRKRAFRKFLFLDVDGVLNYAAFLLRQTEKSKEIRARTDLTFEEMSICPDAVARLQRILDETGALVVLSSSWRYMYQPDAMVAVLAKHGFKGGIIDSTPLSGPPHKCRGDEIAWWLKNRAPYWVKSYVILDDDSDMGEVAERLVHTSFETGLTDELADKAIAMLNAKDPRRSQDK